MSVRAYEAIPDLAQVRSAKSGYRNHPIEAYTEYDEPLVDIEQYEIRGANYYFQEHNPPYNHRVSGSIPSLYVRTSVAEKLAQVNDTLSQEGYELFVHDAWRPAAVQHYFHTHWFPQEIKQSHPDWSLSQIEEEVSRYWAHGPQRDADIDPESPPPHATGGAVDLTLKQINGDIVFMGSAFDEASTISFTDALEARNESPIKFLRRMLYWNMRQAGFVNNPTEWWHYSYGDQMWAKLKASETDTTVKAIYGAIIPPIS